MAKKQAKVNSLRPTQKRETNGDDEKIIQLIKNSPHEKIKVAVTDIDGVLRGKYLRKEKFLSALSTGFGFCNVVFGWDSADVCYDNGHYTGWHSGYPDATAMIDLATYREVPWDNSVPFFLADFVDADKNPLEVCPRQLLKQVLAKATSMNFKPMVGMEYEWFNFKETSESWAAKGYHSPTPLTPGMFGYSIIRTAANQPFFAALMDEMNAFRIPVEGLHTETGPGVFEAAILYSEALEAADRAVLFKTATKEIGRRFGILPSFMAKWNAKLPGCSGHLHQSLWSSDTTKDDGAKNLFYSEKGGKVPSAHMSPIFESYLAGQLALLPEILPLLAPTVNSYKRLVDGFWAPTKTTWGVDNRTVACRVIPGSSKSTRLETRVPGSDVNPYLSMAACLAAGLYGIEKRLKLTTNPIVGSAYHDETSERLPRSLQDATARLSQSKVVHEILGSTFVDHFVKTREWEWRQFQDSVTQWELERYFEII